VLCSSNSNGYTTSFFTVCQHGGAGRGGRRGTPLLDARWSSDCSEEGFLRRTYFCRSLSPPPLVSFFPPACSFVGASLKPDQRCLLLFEEPAACSVVNSCRFMSIYGWRRGGQVKRSEERRRAPQVSSDMELLLRITFVVIKAVLPALLAKLSIRLSLPERIRLLLLLLSLRCCCCGPFSILIEKTGRTAIPEGSTGGVSWEADASWN